jgi:hypothetical protein
MPTNLPPNAQAAEKRYKEAETPEEKVEALEEYLALIPKHKGTDHLRADLRRTLARLKESAQTRRKISRQDSPYRIDKEGIGQVALIGPTNTGKSALVTMLTNATPEVSDAPFTTWGPTPGMMPVHDVQVQLVDTPPLTREFVEPEFLALLRRADLLLMMVDLQADPLAQLDETVAILNEHRIVPQHRQDGYAGDERRLTFKPVLVVANKNDDEDTDELLDLFGELLDEPWPIVPLSALTGRGLDAFRQTVFRQLHVVRIYSKAPGREPDRDTPFVLPEGSTVEDLARRLHRDFYEHLKAARVWGSGIFEGQLVGRDHVLHDGDVVELRI